MKLRYIFCAGLLVLSASSQAAETLCQQKEQDIQREIGMARKHDNQRRVNGLERALTEARANCSDNKLHAAHQQRIQSQQQKIAERERELKDAQHDAKDQKKIAKRQQKLDEARQELKTLQAAPY